MAVALEWDSREPVTGPIAVATVYLRTHRTQVVDVRSDTLNVGFRSTVAEVPSDEIALVEIVDRALVRGRRHAVVLAGHGLDRELARLPTPAGRRLPGVLGVSEMWAGREARQRGTAVMVDTERDVRPGSAQVDVALQPAPRHQGAQEPDVLAACGLARCTAIALVAAAHVGAYRWTDRFAVRQAVEAVAWDRMDRVDWSELPL